MVVSSAPEKRCGVTNACLCFMTGCDTHLHTQNTRYVHVFACSARVDFPIRVRAQSKYEYDKIVTLLPGTDEISNGMRWQCVSDTCRIAKRPQNNVLFFSCHSRKVQINRHNELPPFSLSARLGLKVTRNARCIHISLLHSAVVARCWVLCAAQFVVVDASARLFRWRAWRAANVAQNMRNKQNTPLPHDNDLHARRRAHCFLKNRFCVTWRGRIVLHTAICIAKERASSRLTSI